MILGKNREESMNARLDPNKAKTARRVIEVLEFFDEQNRHATVMDIARRYKRPQSSTSELLAILVEMGLLYKDPGSRSFKPTPRAAMLGSIFQPDLVRDGRLPKLADDLRARTGLGALIMGMVGLDVQIFRCAAGVQPIATSVPNAMSGGAQTPLHESAAGRLLLSTIAPERRGGMLRRLSAEAPEGRKFNVAELAAQIQACGRQGYAVGPAGFGARADMCAILLPAGSGERPMVLGLVYEPNDKIDPQALVELVRSSLQGCVGEADDQVLDLERYRTRADERPARTDGASPTRERLCSAAPIAQPELLSVRLVR
jgi:DNA-binding IclR family transcriptional regulator